VQTGGAENKSQQTTTRMVANLCLVSLLALFIVREITL